MANTGISEIKYIMKKIRTLLIDSAFTARQTLSNALAKHCPDIEVAGETDDIEEAVEMIMYTIPEIVFLDIGMPAEHIYQLLTQLNLINCFTIFVGAQKESNVPDFKDLATEYLFKPVLVPELIIAVHRIRKLIDYQRRIHQLSSFLEKFKRFAEPTKIALPTMEGLIYVHTMEIIRCEAKDNYTQIYFKCGKTILVSRTLAIYEKSLKEKGFIRVHHQHLVNLQYVEKYIRGRGGMVIMSDEKEIQVSQRKKNELLKILSIGD